MFKPTRSSLHGKIAVITGGTEGIGKGICKQFVLEGAKVFILSRSLEKWLKLQKELQVLVDSNEKTLSQVQFLSTDVTNPKEIQLSLNEITTKHKEINILIANAGIYPPKTLETFDISHINSVIDLNLKGTLYFLQAFSPYLAENSRILVISSITGPCTGIPGYSLYGATKAAQLGLVKGLALELAPRKITVNAILPGNIETEGLVKDCGEQFKKMAEETPLKRLGFVEDIAYLAVFLASNYADYITGQGIVVDGGLSVKEI